MKEKYPLPEPTNKDIIKRIIGIGGQNLRDMERKAVLKPYSIHQKRNEVHITGPEEKVEVVKSLLKEIIDKVKKQECAKDEMVFPLTAQNKYKVNIPPAFELGHIIGRQHCNLKKIMENTGARIVVYHGEIYVSGEANNCKKAVIKIKNKVNEVLNKKPIPDQFNFILATEQCEYKLKEFDCPNPSWNGEKHFKVYTIDEDNEVRSPEDFNTEELQEFICNALRNIQQENEGKEIKADFWCHFGHLYIGNIDEEDQSKEYNVDELQTELTQNKNESWKVRFDPAIKELDIEALENTLKTENNGLCVNDSYIRHDFRFYAPDYTSVRAKVFMNVDGNLDSTLATHDIDIKENQDIAASPQTKYLLCDLFETKARVNIMIVSEGMDCRLTIRTASPNDNSKAKEFEKNVTNYMDKITIVNNELCMPEDSELPEDYCMYYWRRCRRRIYPYEGMYSITISEEDVMDTTEGGQVKDTKTDIHLHCNEWDRLLASGKWEPEQIVERLPHFLKFVRAVQFNVQD